MYFDPTSALRRAATWLCLAVFAGSAMVVVGSADAQELERRETVAERARPALDPKGLPVGAFTLLPSLGLEVRHDDNIFATDTFEEDDLITLLRPEVRLQSNWSRHRVLVAGDAAIARYDEFDGEDYEDIRVWAQGRFDVRNGQADATLRHSELHEDRTSVDDRRGIAPTEYSEDSLYAAYTYRPGRLLLRGSFDYQALDFDDTETLTGSVSNDDRDRDRTGLGLRAGYEMSPDYILFVEGKVDAIDYDQQFADCDNPLINPCYERSSDGLEVVAGAMLDFSGRTFGEVYAGYIERDYDDARFGKADGPTFGADLTWNVTGLTTVEFSASRTIDSTTIIGAAGIETTRFGVSADHELLRNLLLSLDMSTTTEDFEGVDREDDIRSIELGARYLMNRYMYLSLGYRWRDRDSSLTAPAGRDYSIQDLFLQIVGQL
jgi:hypothetical protein